MHFNTCVFATVAADSYLFTKGQSFRPVQIESIYRQQNTCNLIPVLEWLENIVGKGENAGYQHFPLFPLCFQSASFS